jgi:predicted nucleic acid-binding protein
MNYLLDTNVISELISRQPNPKVIDWLDSLDPTAVFLSVITIGEVRKGIEKLLPSQRRETLSTWLETDLPLRFQGHIVAITTDVMLVWGALVARLENEGRPVAAIDSLLAASTLQGGYTFVTRNEADFLHTGAMLANPWK